MNKDQIDIYNRSIAKLSVIRSQLASESLRVGIIDKENSNYIWKAVLAIELLIQRFKVLTRSENSVGGSIKER